MKVGDLLPQEVEPGDVVMIPGVFKFWLMTPFAS